ncbi:MAG: DinB family protein [Chloroflexi bacterium]|nr:DinB family protein [Chloroflexota bacterium]
MKRDDIQLLYQYNEWANRRILDAAAGVSPEELTAPNDLGWGDLRGLLVHIMTAEIGWRNRLSGLGEVARPEATDFPDVASISARYKAETAKLWDYLNGLSDADVSGPVTFERDGRQRSSTLWHFLAHVVNHGTQHRAECAALLTGFGHSPGDMDFTLFLRQREESA